MIGGAPIEGLEGEPRGTRSWQALLGAVFGSGRLWIGVVWGATLGAAVVAIFQGPNEAVKVGGLLVVLASLAGVAGVVLRGFRRLLLAVVLLDTVIRVDVHLFFRPAVGDMGGLGGLNLSLTTLALAALYGSWLIGLLSDPRTTPRPHLVAAASALAYVALVALTAFFASDPVLAAFELGVLVQALLILVYVVSMVRTRVEVVFVVSTLFVGVLIESLITILTGVTHTQFSFYGITNGIDPVHQVGRVWRAGGTLGGPNAAAAMLVVLLAPAFAVGLSRYRSALRLLAQVSFGLGAVALIITRSRGGWISLTLACIVVLIVMTYRGKVSKRALAGVAVAFVIACSVTLPLVIARIQSDDDGALASRGPLNAIAGRMIRTNPVLGVGPNNFAVELPNYVTPVESREWLFTVHNQYLLVWSEGGTFVFLAFLAFLLTGLHAGRKAVRYGDDLSTPIALGLTAGLAGRMLHMTIDLIAARPAVQTLWVTVALLIALALLSRREAVAVGS